MPVRITCRQTELKPEHQDLIIKKAEKLKRFFEKVERIEITFTQEKTRHICEINVHAAPFDAAAKAENHEPLNAFDKTMKAVESQIVSQKEKHFERRKKAVNPAKGTRRDGHHMEVAAE